MSVVRAVLLTVGLALAGLAACRTEHGPSADNLQEQITELRDQMNGLGYEETIGDPYAVDAEPTPSPSLTPDELEMINSWYPEPTPSPSPAFDCPKGYVPACINEAARADWAGAGLLRHPMRPSPSPTPADEVAKFAKTFPCGEYSNAGKVTTIQGDPYACLEWNDEWVWHQLPPLTKSMIGSSTIQQEESK